MTPPDTPSERPSLKTPPTGAPNSAAPPTETIHLARPSELETTDLTQSLGRATADLEPVEPIDAMWGRFRLLEKVGRGGFGDVYRAWDIQLNREVALKLLQGGSAEEDYQSILREARAAARVKHPNVVPVFGVDRFDGRVGFWSEFVRGKHLGRLVDEQGPFSANEAAHIGIEVCRATSAVHSAGMLHRDIKASNVMREAGGRILLMDFGLTQEVSREGDSLSGTLLYMAPEMLDGEPASAQSDIYALGILLFYLTSGEYPADVQLGNPAASLVRKKLIDLRPDLPESFVRIVETATSIDPAHRYQSIGEMMSALSAFVSSPAASEASPIPGRIPQLSLFQRIGTLPLALIALSLIAGAIYLSLNPWKQTLGAFSTGANEEYSKGQDLLVRYDKPGNIDQAISLYQKLTQNNPDFALGYAGLAEAYVAQFDAKNALGVLDQARSAATKAIALDDRQARAHLALAKCYIRKGTNDLAVQELNEALRLDSRSAPTHAELGLLYRGQGRIADVVPTLQTAIDLAPNDWRWPNRLGLFYLSAGKDNEAAQQFQKITELTPDNRFGYANLGLAYRHLGKFDQAMEQYRKALAIDPHYSQALINMGAVLTWQGKYNEAVDIFKRATDEAPRDYRVWASLASAYYWSANGRQQAASAYRNAVELAEVRRTEDPANAQLLADLGCYYAALGDRAHGLPLIRQGLALSPDEPVLLSRAAMGYELLGLRGEAITHLVRALHRGYSYEFVERNPELAELRRDPKFIAKLPKAR